MSPAQRRSQLESSALVAAAGAGLRLGRGPKAFLSFAGRTLLERCVRALAPFVDEIVVAVPEGELERARQLVPEVRLIAGGMSRQETVDRLAACSSGRLCLVHDVARPCLPPDVLKRVMAAAAKTGAATAALPVADTLVREDDGETPDREALRAIQTPQAFRRDLLLEAHRRARAEGRTATDDAALVRALGAPVELVTGSPWLFKLTGPDDLDFASRLIAAWDGSAASD